MTFIDTSAIFALVDRSDPAHRPAAAAFMRARGIDTAFAVDRDFRIAGFNVLPEPTD